MPIQIKTIYFLSNNFTILGVSKKANIVATKYTGKKYFIWVASKSQKYVLTNRVNVLASPHANDKHKFPKKNIKKDLFPNAILSSVKIAVNVIDPDHFDNESISFLVDKDEYKTLKIIINAPVTANGNHASGFNCPCGNSFVDAKGSMFLGRGSSFPIALEGALKLKELAYIHAEGYPAGEMKHGPLALIEDGMPVVVIAPRDYYYNKTISNMQEVIARGAKVLLITNKSKDEVVSENIWETIEVESTNEDLLPFLLTIPLQKLAYYSALKKGYDIDKPRNLAKSVTVE